MVDRAACSSAFVISRPLTESAFTASKRLVYSSTASSPRFFTSARMAETRSSIAWSVSADQRRTRSNSASKSLAVVESWRIREVMVSPDGGRERIDDAADRFAFGLERGLVHH